MKRVRIFTATMLSIICTWGLTYAQVVRDPVSYRNTLILNDQQGQYPLGELLEILEDRSRKLTISEVSSPEFDRKFVPYRTEVPNYDISKSVHWVRFRIRNEARLTRQWFLQIAFTLSGLMKLYLPKSDGSGFQSTPGRDFFPANPQQIAYPTAVFKLPLAHDKEKVIYLRFPSCPPQSLRLTLWSPEEFDRTGYVADAENIKLIPVYFYILEPGTKRVPNFNKMKASGIFFVRSIDFPIDSGNDEFPGVPMRKNWLGLRIYVKFSVEQEEEGALKFRLVVRDGARLIVGKKVVVRAQASGELIDKSGQVTLQAGTHELFLDYFRSTGPSALQLYISRPGKEGKIFAVH